MKQPYCIYALYENKASALPFYIGKTKNPRSRFLQHCATYGAGIDMFILHSIDCDSDFIMGLEGCLIKHLKALGVSLLNKNWCSFFNMRHVSKAKFILKVHEEKFRTMKKSTPGYDHNAFRYKMYTGYSIRNKQSKTDNHGK